ncbi:hypothetical protein [Vibrio sp. 1180_3]|nr:hypothetical protein [Vibrio sp. 1180_3]
MAFFNQYHNVDLVDDTACHLIAANFFWDENQRFCVSASARKQWVM